MHEQSAGDHILRADPFGGERVAQREAVGRRVAKRKLALNPRVEPTIGEIAPRLGADLLL
jgi:hypothetical protein